MREFIRRCFSLCKEAFSNLRKHDPIILASSTSFFTAFSIIPILVILFNLLGLYFKNQELNVHVIGKLEEVFGKETGTYLQSILSNINKFSYDWIYAILGIVFLVFVATNLFKIIKLSINRIWSIKRKHVNRLKYTLSERVVALGVLFFTAILLGLSISLDTAVVLMNKYLQENLPSVELSLIKAVNILFSLLVVTIWFTIIFKVLPDAKLHWRVASMGGLFTAILFTFGKWVLGKLLVYSAIANIFGASASMALILLFIFYSSLILYYGAAFTQAFGHRIGKPVLSGKYSEKYDMVIVDDEREK